MKSIVTLEKVTATEAQVEALYELLGARRYSISHKVQPSFLKHQEFVRNHPYRVWYIVNLDSHTIGTAYVQYDNAIGLTNLEEMDVEVIEEVLLKLTRDLLPLDAIPSVRFGDFFFRVSFSNNLLQKKLEKLGYRPSEICYTSAE